jgi:hypothetical protein
MNKNILKILLVIVMVIILAIIMFVSEFEQKEVLPKYLREEVEFDVNNPEERAKYIKSFEEKRGVIIIDDELLDPEL